MTVAGVTTYRRRRAVVAATFLTFLGVAAFALRASEPHPGRTPTPALLGVGILAYVTPFAFSVDRAMRQGRTRMGVVVFIGSSGAVFLATRPVGNFSQIWPIFTMIVSIVVLHVSGQFQHDSGL